MPRANRAARGGRTASKRLSLDFSNVGKAFEPGKEYGIEVAECTLEDGQKAPYFNLKLVGLDEEYAKAAMYHRASTSESSLWRLRPLLEAFGMDVPDGPMDIGPEDFIGKRAMCSTYLDRYEGGSSVKPDEFWPLEGDDTGDDGKEGDAPFDLDELDDDDIKALAEELEVEGRNTAALKRGLKKLDQDDVAEAWEKLQEGDEPAKEEPKSRRGGKAKEEDEPEEKPSGRRSRRGKDKEPEKVSEAALGEMNEDELEELVEKHELDIDLSEHKTLRKKRNALMDALEEKDLLED